MDAVIIGSGLSGLTTAAFLTKQGFRTTLLEQHYQPGGYAHNFSRRGYRFEAAIHTAPLARTGVLFSLFEQLGIADAITTVRQDEMFRVKSGDKEYCIPHDPAHIRQALYDYFPEEKPGLDRFFADLEEVYTHMFTLFTPDKKGYPDKDPGFARKFQGQSYASYLAETFAGEEIQQVLGGQWPYVGIPPQRGSRLFLTMLFATHYFNGSHSIRGGFSTLVDALLECIERGGGQVVLKEEVSSINIENKYARGVYTTSDRYYEADLVVADCNPYLLHHTLIPEQWQSKRFHRRLSLLQPSLSSVAVYLGMKPGYEEYVQGNVILWYDDMACQEELYTYTRNKTPYQGDYLMILNPREPLGEKPVLTLLTFADQKQNTQWKSEKERVGQKMVDALCSLYPGLEAYIDLIETGSPDTFYRYTRNEEGAIYGFENSCEPFQETKLSYTTHIKNLYQCGHWSLPGCGVYNVITNGYTVAKQIQQDRDNGKI
ncbi:phytoene desaturase family protein [Chitinivibrio alkaliphilus]|uniref:Phytoene dehydrogenase n=1 Tax=Chitinivibrio alkaliphilus ACht1 TaxID=1313304 RepID=U7D8Y5_9BACT|nr:NAD(P)/FAD-dependent oxidoreductase [Chitinivibrio alkaliphilus]ERP30855.1 Phytoene dehydrogenase [Chitinivibrio alkaliphilus ACht1]